MKIDELYELLHPETLPLFKFGRQAHYEGSIDKKGGNADWDWELYRQLDGESVLFEQQGPGCICNFVQHRYLAAAEPTFRFYFDGEKTPRFTLKPSEFGEKYPFLPPLADKFIGPARDGQVIRVVRSFLPMPFLDGCKITSDIPLFGNAGYGGGWGHVVFHTYSCGRPAKSFDPADPRYRRLAMLWQECGNGRSPLRPKEAVRRTLPAFRIAPGGEREILKDGEGGAVTSLRLTVGACPPETLRRMLAEVLVKIAFDGHEEPDIFLPLGCFFGNELGHHAVNSMFTASDGEGRFRFSFPMPYGESVKIALQNAGEGEAVFDGGEVETTKEYAYEKGRFGYLMSAPYYPKAHTHAADSVIADLSGVSGHMISSTVTGYKGKSGWADCEGDVRIHFDGIRTPQIESDGSESYACYGWGFCSPPQCNPVSGYDGKELDVHADWSMTRHLPGDFYPFHDRLHFGIESFGHNNADREMFHSGGVLFYGRREPQLLPLLRFTEGEEQMTAYFEGDDDHIPVTLRGTRGAPIEFSVDVPQGAGLRELVLRRVSDQTVGRQTAKVYLNGRELSLLWYTPDHNPYKQWLEDEYVLGDNLLTGGELAGGRLTVRIEPQTAGGGIFFNQFGIEVYGRRW